MPNLDRIFELAIPKGNITALCEICGQKATTKCESCKKTHYCSEYHRDVDLKSFHQQVCQLIASVRKDQPLPFTEEDRKEASHQLLRKEREIQLLAEITTRKWLLHENAEYAYPAAMSALNIAKQLSGPEDLSVIFPTCLVAEACLWLGDIEAAQEYTVLANWVSQKYEKIPPRLFAQLQRTTGLVCVRARNWELARRAFAECLYAVTVEFGTADIRGANPYGNLGLALLKFGNQESAMASFHKMADKWLDHLLQQYGDKTLRRATELEMIQEEGLREMEFQYLEGKIVCKWVYEAVRRLGMDPVTDLINFKILSIQALSRLKDARPAEAAVYKQEALATATRTKQDKAVPRSRVKTLMEVLGEDYILLWEKRHNRPRTIATKYLEMIKAINI